MDLARRLLLIGCAAVFVVVTALPGVAGQDVFDGTVAEVDGELILKSDILWNLALDPAVAPVEFWDPAVQRLMLRTLIDQRILLQEAAKLPATRVTDEEIAVAREDLAGKFYVSDDPTRFERRLQLVGLSGPRLGAILRERQQILKFVDFRFRSFVVVTEPEIVRYFESEVKPSLEDQTAVALEKAFAAERPTIERALIEEKINNAIDEYLEQARARARVVVFDGE
jgi:hypothetical protein